jgi:pilus assembly protein Flp/PilA
MEEFMRTAILKFLNDEAAASSIEYGMLAFGIAVAIVVAVLSLGTELNSNYTNVEQALQ